MSPLPTLALGRARLASHPRLFSSAELVTAAGVLRGHGLRCDALLHHGLTRDHLSDPSRRISLTQAIEAFLPINGLFSAEMGVAIGGSLHLSTFGIPGFALLSCATLMDAVRCAQQYWPLFNLKYQFDIIEHEGIVQLALKDRFGVLLGESSVFAMLEIAKLITLCRDLAGPHYDPVRIGLLPDHGNISLISRAKIVVGDTVFLEVPASVMHAALPQANPAIHRHTLTLCDHMIDDLFKEPSLVRRIKGQLATLDDGVPSLSDIAATLCMSERTLRRRLQGMDTSYYRLLDEVRMEMAEQYLRDDGVTTDVIAERLGYAEVANFRHAFKRWTGCSPRSFCLADTGMRQ